MAKFRTTLHQYASVSKKTFQEICNDKALDLAHKSLEETQKADKNRIEHVLGQVGNELRFTRKGKLRKGRHAKGARLIKADSFAARIINKRLVDKGENPIFGQELVNKVDRFIAARLRSIGFIKSGWLPAIRKLSRLSSNAAVRAAANQQAQIRGKEKGYAIEARQVFAPSAEIANSATKGSFQSAKLALQGMLRAIPRVEADMRVYIERKLQEATDKVIGK